MKCNQILGLYCANEDELHKQIYWSSFGLSLNTLCEVASVG